VQYFSKITLLENLNEQHQRLWRNKFSGKCSNAGCNFEGNMLILNKHEMYECPYRRIRCPARYCFEVGTYEDIKYAHWIDARHSHDEFEGEFDPIGVLIRRFYTLSSPHRFDNMMHPAHLRVIYGQYPDYNTNHNPVEPEISVESTLCLREPEDELTNVLKIARSLLPPPFIIPVMPGTILVTAPAEREQQPPAQQLDMIDMEPPLNGAPRLQRQNGIDGDRPHTRRTHNLPTARVQPYSAYGRPMADALRHPLNNLSNGTNASPPPDGFISTANLRAPQPVSNTDPEAAASADQWIARLPPVPSIIPTRPDSVPRWVAEINRNNIFGVVRRRLPNGQIEETTADSTGYSRITFSTRGETSTTGHLPTTATYDEMVRFEDENEPATRERSELPSTQPPVEQTSRYQVDLVRLLERQSVSLPVAPPQPDEQEEEVEMARIDDEDDPPASNESTIAQYSTSDEENDSFNFGADLH
jgi:hypothetical protein